MTPIPITRAEYEKKFGVKPSISTSTLNTTPAPIRVTRAEWEALQKQWKPQEEQGNVSSAISGLGTLYGGSDQGIARKLQSDIITGASDIQQGWQKLNQNQYDSSGAIQMGKGVVKAGLRTAGDVAGAVYAPISALFEATGVNKLFDQVQKNVQDGKGLVGQAVNKITDIPAVQDFATKHPNASEDFGRVMNIVLGSLDKGKIEPKTAISRTKEQGTSVLNKGAEIKTDIQNKLDTRTSVKRQKILHDIETNYAGLRKNLNTSSDGNASSRARVADTKIWDNVVNTEGKMTTMEKGGAYDQYRKATIDGQESVVRDNLVREGAKVNLEQVAKELRATVTDSGLEGADLLKALKGIDQHIKGLRIRADELGNVPLESIHDAKINETNNINYKVDEKPTITYRKAIARTYKEIIENTSKTEVKKVNNELLKYYKDLEYIQSLDGKRVNGGKLGKYFAQISGNIIGGAVGGAVGGPVGMAVGTVIGGESAGFLKGKVMSRSLGKGGKDIPRNPILENARADAKLPPVTDLKTPDKPMGVAKGIKKTPEILKIEGQIKRNVELQKKAIKAGQFDLVLELKVSYAELVTKLKTAIKTKEEVSLKEKIQSYKDGKRKTKYKTAPTTNKKAIPNSTTKSSPTKDLSTEAKKYPTPEAFVKAQTADYKMQHQAPIRGDGYNAPGYDVSGGEGIYPKDIYTDPRAYNYYGHGSDVAMDKQTIELIRKMQGKPDAEITIYRAVPKDESITKINPSDWVTINKNYAKEHGESQLDGNYKILEKKVRADEIFTDGNSIHEFGYDPREGGTKSKSQLTDIWKEANRKVSEVEK